MVYTKNRQLCSLNPELVKGYWEESIFIKMTQRDKFLASTSGYEM